MLSHKTDRMIWAVINSPRHQLKLAIAFIVLIMESFTALPLIILHQIFTQEFAIQELLKMINLSLFGQVKTRQFL